MVFSLNPVIEATVWAVGLRLDLVKGFTELNLSFRPVFFAFCISFLVFLKKWKNFPLFHLTAKPFRRCRITVKSGKIYHFFISGTKNLHTIPFSGFYLAAKATIAVFAARFPSSGILSNRLLGLFLGKATVALCGVFPFGRTVGFLAQVARPRPCSKNDIELSQINGEAIRRTVKPEGGKTRRPKRKTTMGYDGRPLLGWGFQGGLRPPWLT